MSTKYIFVTGGVVSSLGKGITAASLATLLECRNLKVTMMKLDPYINIDPGTMSPLQHGEVYVTQDGAETDLDLGHYERFICTKMTKKNNFTAGQVYQDVINKERKGEYLGKTVQVIPHITDEIKHKITSSISSDINVAIIEIGGTVGDIESLPFLEAMRQLHIELGKQNSIFIHLTLLPYIKVAGELKTKPTQHSVKELLSIGIQPDILVCRCEQRIPDEDRLKIALFTNVDKDAVFTALDASSIYKIPIQYYHQGIDRCVAKKLQLDIDDANLTDWIKVSNFIDNSTRVSKIAMVGKYTLLTEAYKSLNEALIHAGIHTQTKIEIDYIDSDKVTGDALLSRLEKNDAILIPGGFGERGITGKIQAITYARENNIPFLGICLGMQMAVIEYAKNVLKLTDANSTEFNSSTSNPIIGLIHEWQNNDGKINVRTKNSDLGGTMRLGAQDCILKKDSRIKAIYKKNIIQERHRHRYEVNNTYLSQLVAAGLTISGQSSDQKLVEVIEITSHKWFIACQFHPEFTSTPRNGHPLFISFIEASLENRS